MTRPSKLALTAVAVALTLALPAAEAAAQSHKPAQPAAELPGASYDYEYDGLDIGHPERRWLGRAYVPPEAAASRRPLPLVVFLHGLNAARIKHRWLGGGNEGDVRRMIGDLISRGVIAPAVVAGPSSIVPSEVAKGASWRHFDLDGFIDRTVARLDGIARIDPRRIVVAGHSGAGCSPLGGLAKLNHRRHELWAILAIDTCMSAFLAESLARQSPETHVVVTYQTRSWSRPWDLFRQVFERERQEHPAAAGVLRVVDHLQPDGRVHDATVPLTFERWLPKILSAASAQR